MKTNINYIQLYNILNRITKSDAIKIENFNFTASPIKNIALSINAFSCNFVLVPLSYSFVKDTIENIEDKDIANIDDTMLLGMLELYMQKYFKTLGDSIEASIVVEKYITDFNKDIYPYAFSFSLNNIPFTIYVKDDDTINACIQKFEVFKANEASFSSNEIVNDIDVILNYNIGLSSLSLKDLKDIEVGDAICLDNFFLTSDFITISTSDYFAKAKIENQNLVLTSKFFKGKISMSSPDEAQNPTSNTEENQDTINFDNIPLNVSYVIERTKFNIKDLKELKEGDKLPLNNKDLSQVIMVVNDKTVATGRIIDVGNHYAFQVTKIGIKEDE